MPLTPLQTPAGVIKILWQVPLDNTYTNTIFFESEAEQQTYFNSMVKPHPNGGKWVFNDVTFTRLFDKNKVRVEGNAMNFYDCNYIMFQNENFGSKWFYAFITAVEYISNYVCEITFEIDVIQTWFFQFTLKSCFVLRETSYTDEVGDNIVAENIDMGNIIQRDKKFIAEDYFSKWSALLFSTFWDGRNPEVNIINGNVIGCFLHDYPNILGTADSLQDALKYLEGAGHTNDIVNIALFPTSMVNYNEEAKVLLRGTTDTPLQDFDGYKPKNNKLFTFPYNYVRVGIFDKYKDYRYEFFDDIKSQKYNSLQLEFNVTPLINVNPVLMLTPLRYKGITTNFNEEFSFNGFPTVPYTTDYFKQWIAQHGWSTAISLGTSVGSFALGIATGSPVGAFMGAMGFAQGLGNIADNSNRPNSFNEAGDVNVDFARDRLKLYYSPMQITREYAETIDNFFDMYGYAVNKNKIPNIYDSSINQFNARQYWYYLQCGSVNFKWIGDTTTTKTTSVLTNDIAKIADIFKNGITFWNSKKDLKKIGDYSQDNQCKI